MAQRRSSFSVLAAALCAAILSLGIFVGFVSAQESPSPAGSTATTSPFDYDQQFGQIVLIDGQWVDAKSVSPDGLQQAPEQWIRGNLEVKTYLPECPRGWTMTDKDGNEYYDSNFGTIGTQSSEAMKLRNLLGHNVEVHLVRDMPCMNTQERFWRLASVRALDGYSGTSLFLPITIRGYNFYNVDLYGGLVALIADGNPNMDYVLLNACGELIAHIENAPATWNGRWVAFNAFRYERNGQEWLRWDGSPVRFTDPSWCWWTPTPTFTPTPSTTPSMHHDIWGWLERADPRECPHAWVRSCNGLGRFAVRHPNGPAALEPYFGKEVAIVGDFVGTCGDLNATLITGINLAPRVCDNFASPTPTFTSTPTPTVTPTTDPNLVEGYIIMDPAPGACGNARLLTACFRTYGWVTNADTSWNGRWVRFRISNFDLCSDPSLVKVTWDTNPSTVVFVSPAPQCATPTPTHTPTATEPGNPSATPTFTATPTATRTNTPVPPPTTPPTAVPGSFTAYLFTVANDDGLGECGNLLGVLCSGEIVKIINPGAFEEGKSYNFQASWLAECRHDDHGHRILQVTSALTPTSCPTGSPVEVPEWKPCSGPLCWRYKITEMAGLPPLILLLPYPRPLIAEKAPAIPE